ncbi:hypothetical protein TPHA_0A01260 [Tetrapisispora phaffii CBS 4417]|uniref:Tyrosine--tRNA ligase n=1 Tax=Tetrapisispora phaffii (strain ATCC 24235 / CBS 4417 / NBRC 1672 / NRRL Y-8282 / UCD 70-5) TaxID=1071381 RepID=G8BMT2_TETPH|nr:hypothetical protein TPHA_0A01260 [Tetrapisispora phaffii CBS 4417]CCE61210.1 hypothetical protein TPHA_0A01260 [Tetrapisispora phaffii CBS 4417]
MFLKRIFQKRTLNILAKDGNLISELRARGLIAEISQPETQLIDRIENREKLTVYCGADPTARSLHLGNMVPLMILLNFYVRGHNVITLVGGATGKVGDPSGRKTERTALKDEVRLDNITYIGNQFSRFFDNGLQYWKNKNISTGSTAGTFTKVNNYDWWKDVKILDFLSTYGKSIRIQSMMSRDSVQSRLTSPEGLGFNEFTYQILQAYDYLHLYRTFGTTIQVGGNDQWGNITAGIDLISRMTPEYKKSPAFAITAPLLTTMSGEKFGKSAGNAIFLDPSINSAYDIYQYFYNTADADVSKFLKIFTLIPLEEIEEIVSNHLNNPQLREGQKILAKEVTDLLHGIGTGIASQRISDITFGKKDVIKSYSSKELMSIFKDANILQVGNPGETLNDLVARLTESSKSEARRKIKQGSIYLGVNKDKIIDPEFNNLDELLMDNELLILRVGKQKCFAIKY